MILPDPNVVVLATPRSGSSLTTGILSKHGFWTGRCREADENNPKGYFENLDIKALLKRHCGAVHVSTGTEAEPILGFKGMTENILPKYGWAVKHSAMYWRVWDGFDVKFILVRRPDESIFQSNYQTGFMVGSPEKIRNSIKRHSEVMDKIDGVNVFTDEIVKGDYSSLERAFEYLQLPMDRDIVDDFVEPRHWHF